jgi:hypothetical protein
MAGIFYGEDTDPQYVLEDFLCCGFDCFLAFQEQVDAENAICSMGLPGPNEEFTSFESEDSLSKRVFAPSLTSGIGGRVGILPELLFAAILAGARMEFFRWFPYRDRRNNGARQGPEMESKNTLLSFTLIFSVRSDKLIFIAWC